ncbi:hypothetical protein BIFADO_01517 [Bifidobacterium adolescentis L2-32]|uniref:Uncharacterized protein n=1 Tax=Bifidobacterium adolescentis L2-32 TaxID=411481 RepID=A7A6N4_BIFAD|nr:hypothetical protein BIFADO_01517 [Bifidobacterium adolescentis L2-32]
MYAFARKGRIDFRRFFKPAAAAFAGSAISAWDAASRVPAFLSS